MTNRAGSFAGPYNEGAAVVKSDSTAIGGTDGVQCLYVGTAGDVVVRLKFAATVVTLKNVPAGAWLPVNCDRVMAATAAADIVAFW